MLTKELQRCLGRQPLAANKISNVYSLEHTDIPNVLLTPRHITYIVVVVVALM
jgi:hypothetical protein